MAGTGLSFATEVIYRLRAVLADDGHGNLLPDWSQPPEETAIPGCTAQPGATNELETNRDSVLVAWTVWAPYGSDVRAGDRVSYLGRVYAVNGEPGAWRSPTGAVSNLQIQLRAWEG